MSEEQRVNDQDLHRWVRARLVPWRAGLLDPGDAERVAAHLRECPSCHALETAFAIAPASDLGQHLPASLIAQWPQASRSLRGLERALARHHLERCTECRQDLELLGHEARLEHVAELETAMAAEPGPKSAPNAAAASIPSRPMTTIRVIRADPEARGRRLWDRALVTWASLATAAAAIAITVLVQRPVVEGVPSPLLFTLSPPPPGSGGEPEGGPSVRLAPRPRSLSGPARGPRGGKVTVIPVMGPVASLALAVRPLDVPDTSWVQVSLVRGDGDTLLTVLHRQWEFFPKRMLVIDGGDAPLEPGRYALVLASLMAGEASPTRQMSRYLFELRPRPR